MAAITTEQLHRDAVGLDARPLTEIAALLAQEQAAAARVPGLALEAITAGAQAMAAAIRAGGALHYVAAGSSGLMAAADAQELGGTFSIPAQQVHIHMAGGLPTGSEMPGETEDDTAGLDLALADLSERDVVIAVSASGSTPFTLAAMRIARTKGATIIGIANNPGAPLFALADHVILLETAPELVSGSTRMGAGTAQKIALNMLSTLMAVALGHIHDGMMVNLRADNAKLRARAAKIVATVAQVGAQTATQALDATDGAVKPAILIAAGGVSPQDARAILIETDANLRLALTKITKP